MRFSKPHRLISLVFAALVLVMVAQEDIAHGASASEMGAIPLILDGLPGAVANYSVTGAISCTTGGVPIALPADQTTRPLRGIIVHNYSSSVVYLYGTTGAASATKANGVPLCTTSSTCAPWAFIPITSSGMNCAGAVGTVALHYFGVQ